MQAATSSLGNGQLVLQQRQQARAFSIPRVVVHAEITPSLIPVVQQALALPHSYIILHINSPGGCMATAIAICRLVAASGKTVVAVAAGQCSSSALHIFLAAKHRYAKNNVTFIIHQPEIVNQPLLLKMPLALARARVAKCSLITNVFHRHAIKHTALPRSALYKVFQKGQGTITLDTASAQHFGVVHRVL